MKRTMRFRRSASVRGGFLIGLMAGAGFLGMIVLTR
jgi:hypothetical protein